MSTFTSKTVGSELVPEITAATIERFGRTVAKFQADIKQLGSAVCAITTTGTEHTDHASFGESLHFLLAEIVRQTGRASYGPDDGSALQTTIAKMEKDGTEVHNRFLTTYVDHLDQLEALLLSAPAPGGGREWSFFFEGEQDVVLLDQMVQCWTAHALRLDPDLYTES